MCIILADERHGACVEDKLPNLAASRKRNVNERGTRWGARDRSRVEAHLASGEACSKMDLVMEEHEGLVTCDPSGGKLEAGRIGFNA
jgi:hypothetical protein